MASQSSHAEVSVEAAPEGATEQEGRRNRRDLLKALGAAAAGAVAAGVLSPNEAEAHGTFHRDSGNTNPAIHGNNTSIGPGSGVEGTSSNGDGVHGVGGLAGVHGVSDFQGVLGESAGFAGAPGVIGIGSPGVIGRGNRSGVDGVVGEVDPVGLAVAVRGIGGRFGVSGTGWDRGVDGYSSQGAGVFGSSQDGTGVAGNGPTGVFGGSSAGTGILGESGTGYAVAGRATGSGTAVWAQSATGIALWVIGPAKFSTAGSGTIPLGQDSVFVSNSKVTAQSHITAALTGTPGQTLGGLPPVVWWVERQPGTGFVIHMTQKVGRATPFTYLIVEPG